MTTPSTRSSSPKHVSLSGINGKRAEIIKWCLTNASSAVGETATEIADYMFKFHRDLLEQHGRTEKVQAVLRALEAKGEVRRTSWAGNRRGLKYDHWVLVDPPSRED
jgi:hypothetical protein